MKCCSIISDLQHICTCQLRVFATVSLEALHLQCLHFYLWMKNDSPSTELHVLDHMELRVSLSEGVNEFHVARAEVQKSSVWGNVSRGESHPSGWMLPTRGFSNNLLLVSGGETFGENDLHNYRASMPPLTELYFHAEFTWWKNTVMLQRLTPVCFFWNRSERPKVILAIVSGIYTDLHLN